jgi:hypothetical protein
MFIFETVDEHVKVIAYYFFFFVCYYCSGVRLSPLGTAATDDR